MFSGRYVWDEITYPFTNFNNGIHTMILHYENDKMMYIQLYGSICGRLWTLLITPRAIFAPNVYMYWWHNKGRSCLLRILTCVLFEFSIFANDYRCRYMSHTSINVLTLNSPDSKVHGANMGPTWGWKDPGGFHVGPINFALWDLMHSVTKSNRQFATVNFSLICQGQPYRVPAFFTIMSSYLPHDDGIKFTGHRWIPRTNARDAELCCFLWWSVPE